jgi:hypothetical protein
MILSPVLYKYKVLNASVMVEQANQKESFIFQLCLHWKMLLRHSLRLRPRVLFIFSAYFTVLCFTVGQRLFSQGILAKVLTDLISLSSVLSSSS